MLRSDSRFEIPEFRFQSPALRFWIPQRGPTGGSGDEESGIRILEFGVSTPDSGIWNPEPQLRPYQRAAHEANEKPPHADQRLGPTFFDKSVLAVPLPGSEARAMFPVAPRPVAGGKEPSPGATPSGGRRRRANPKPVQRGVLSLDELGGSDDALKCSEAPPGRPGSALGGAPHVPLGASRSEIIGGPVASLPLDPS